MYILKNAWKSITRNKGRNILIGIIFIVIAASCAVTLSILNSANKIVKAYEEKYQVQATIGMNRDNLMSSFKGGSGKPEDMINQFNNLESLSVDEINKYGDSEYVKYYYYTYSLGMNANNVNAAQDSVVKETTETQTKKTTESGGNSSSSDSQSGNNAGGSAAAPSAPGGQGGSSSSGGASGSSDKTTTEETVTKRTEEIKNMRAEQGAFTLVGYNSYSAMSEFISGKYTIAEGEVSSDFTSKTCVISEELAQLNSLSVGSKITFVDPKDSNHTYELEVSGIYKENSESSSNTKNMFSDSANSVLTNDSVVKEIASGNSNLKPEVEPVYVLYSSDDVDSFSNQVKEKGLADTYQVETNLNEISSATSGITNVANFATMFLIVTLVIGAVVLFVINMINIRERKYEIGVLRTIGMSKLKVIWQFVLELLIVALVSICIGACIGAACSVPVANKLLETEIENSASQMQNISSNFGQADMGGPGGPMGQNQGGNGQGGNLGGSGGDSGKGGPDDNKMQGVVNVEQVDSIDAVVDIVVLLELLGLGLGITIISSLAACIAIARFSPLEILRERS